MQSSNPLIVVGISAAIAIGSATTATAKADPSINIETQIKEDSQLNNPQSTVSVGAANTTDVRANQSSLGADQLDQTILLDLVDNPQPKIAGVDVEINQADWNDKAQSVSFIAQLAQAVTPDEEVSDAPVGETLEPEAETLESDESTESEVSEFEELDEPSEESIEPGEDFSIEALETTESTENGLPVLPESDADVEVEVEVLEDFQPEVEAEAEAEATLDSTEAGLVDDPVEADLDAEAPDLSLDQMLDSTTEETDLDIESQIEEDSIELDETEIDIEAQLEEDLTDPEEAELEEAESDSLPVETEPALPTDEPEPLPPSPDSETGTGLESLDPDPNPFSFPTDPSEVEIVGTQPITLAEAIELAIRNNEELQRARLELQRSQAALREAEAANFPTVDVGADLTFEGSEQPDVQQNPFTGEQDADGTELQTNLRLGGVLRADYAIFTSGRRSAIIQAAEREVRLQELAVESATEDLILQVSQAYYDLQAADEQVQIFQAALDEAERSLRDAEALERAGVGTRFDVLQAQVDVANAQQDLRNQLSQQEISRRRLVERLNLSQSVTLAAAEPVEVAGVWDLTLEESIIQAYRNRAELEQQLVQREIAERNRRASLAQLGPQVNLSAQYGVSNTLASDPDSITEDFGFLSSFQVQLGVSLRLFDGGLTRAQARQAEANIAIAESQFANLRDQIRLEVEEAYSQLDANFENIQTTALAVQQAEEALRLARLRFQAGVGTQTDVLRSQTELTRSRFNNLQAILNYNRALVALQRAVSNLPEGFLNEVP